MKGKTTRSQPRSNFRRNHSIARSSRSCHGGHTTRSQPRRSQKLSFTRSQARRDHLLYTTRSPPCHQKPIYSFFTQPDKLSIRKRREAEETTRSPPHAGILTTILQRPQASPVAPTVEKPAAAKTKDTVFVPPPYKPPLPFPGRFKKVLIKKYQALLEKQLKDLKVTMPLVDCLALIPDSHKYVKDMITKRIREVQGNVVLSHECSAIIQTKIIPKKLGDPGSFNLPCSLGPLAFSNCLCDLGASISLMPLSVVKRLGFSKYKSCNISLILADRSVRLPHGLLEDLPIKIGNVEVPTDFIVLEMDEEPKDPLILGRPFLATAGAKPTIEGQTFLVKEMDRLADELLEELADEDHLQTALTKSGEAGYLPTNEASSTHTRPADLTIYSSNPLTRPQSSCSTKLLDQKLESHNFASDDWLKLMERSKWRDKAIRELTDTVRNLKDQIKVLHGKANQGPLNIKDVPNDEAIALVSKEKNEFTLEWIIEEDYPDDQKEAYFEETAIEYSVADLSREHSEFDDPSTEEEEEASFHLHKPP
ncbi:hypothetical protein ISN44_As12g033390 [Arabidopsis suecica]|uniref:Aspartic peptidase DDI1-type domain-containing protein n=1 Tax=Arabidopsis suecica TaxID=45249 RepID=A0A8T1YPE8_ARASU|nr:hypothetical protein ISN44_As12g033390 [Arabidopsis suecica]